MDKVITIKEEVYNDLVNDFVKKEKIIAELQDENKELKRQIDLLKQNK